MADLAFPLLNMLIIGFGIAFCAKELYALNKQ